MTAQKTDRLAELVKLARYKENGQLKPEKIILTIDGKIIGTLANFVTLAGFPKARKTTFMLGFLASALTGREVWKIRATLPEDKKDVLLIDTEQSPYDFAKSMQRLKAIAELRELPENLHAFTFRQHESDTILKATERLLAAGTYGLIVLDSLTDLCTDINNPVEAKKLSQVLKRWTAQYNCCIITLLHLSKTSGSTLGALGAYADRAAQSTILIEKDADGESSTMKAKYLRSDADFLPVSIYWNYNESRYTLQTWTPAPPPKDKSAFNMESQGAQFHSNAVEVLFKHYQELNYAALVDQLGYLYGQSKPKTKSAVIPYLLTNGYLEQAGELFRAKKEKRGN